MSSTVDVAELVREAILDQEWEAALGEWDGATVEQKRAVADPIVALRDEFAVVCEEISDEGERRLACAIFYIQLKSQWMLLNLRSGYLIRTGQLNFPVMVRSGMLTSLLERVERALTGEQVRTLTRFLSQPLDTEASESEAEEAFPIPKAAPAHHLPDTVREVLDARVDEELPPDVTERERELVRLLLGQQHELKRSREELALLAQEFGTVNARHVCDIYANMRRSVASLLDQLNDYKTGRRMAETSSQGDEISVAALQARISELEGQVAAFRVSEERIINAAGVPDLEGAIERLQTTKGLDGTGENVMDELRDVLGSLEQAMERIDLQS